MITIYSVDTMDGNDGRSRVATNYFIDSEDANTFRNKDQRSNCKPESITVWEKGEYSPDAFKKAKALAKLTAEEKHLLGLI